MSYYNWNILYFWKLVAWENRDSSLCFCSRVCILIRQIGNRLDFSFWYCSNNNNKRLYKIIPNQFENNGCNWAFRVVSTLGYIRWHWSSSINWITWAGSVLTDMVNLPLWKTYCIYTMKGGTLWMVNYLINCTGGACMSLFYKICIHT